MQKVSSWGSRRARAGSFFGMRFSVWTYGEPNARRAANGLVLAETFTPRTELWACNDGGLDMATLATLAGDPTRGNMLAAMLDGRDLQPPSLLSLPDRRAVRLWPSRQASPCQVGWSHRPRGHRYYRLALAEI
jgi:hypothetical protein